MTPEKQPKEGKLAKEFIDFKKLEISHHAKKRFFDRTSYDLENQITHLKLRLSEAKIIENHPYEKVKNCLYLQDPFDKDIIYVIGKNKRKKKNVLITVRKPLKKTSYFFLHKADGNESR
jgi:hypothetical protein